jgi:hypothetical protein
MTKDKNDYFVGGVGRRIFVDCDKKNWSFADQNLASNDGWRFGIVGYRRNWLE